MKGTWSELNTGIYIFLLGREIGCGQRQKLVVARKKDPTKESRTTSGYLNCSRCTKLLTICSKAEVIEEALNPLK